MQAVGSSAERRQRGGDAERVELAEQRSGEQRGEEQAAAKARRERKQTRAQLEAEQRRQGRRRKRRRKVEPDRAVSRAEHLRRIKRHARQRQAAERGARPARRARRREAAFEQRGGAHRADADRRRYQAERRQDEVMAERQRRDRRGDDDVGRAEQRLGGQGRRERGGENRAGVGERIGADDQLRRVEGAGERRAERRRDRAAGAAADQQAQILAAQPQRQADARSDGAADLGVARFEPDRGAAAVGDHRLRAHDQAFAHRHAAAAQRVGLDRIDRARQLPGASPGFDQPDGEAAERQRGEGGGGRNPRRRAQSHVERDAVDDDVRDVDELAHRRHAEAGQNADDDRDDDQRQFAGAHDRPQARCGRERPIRKGNLHRVRRSRAPRRSAMAASRSTAVIGAVALESRWSMVVARLASSRAPRHKRSRSPPQIAGAPRRRGGAAMSARGRKLIGGAAMIAFVGCYALIAMAIAQSRPLREAPPLAQALAYVVLGLAWIAPMAPLIQWMERPDRRE